jgi:hypothetical protein
MNSRDGAGLREAGDGEGGKPRCCEQAVEADVEAPVEIAVDTTFACLTVDCLGDCSSTESTAGGTVKTQDFALCRWAVGGECPVGAMIISDGKGGTEGTTTMSASISIM